MGIFLVPGARRGSAAARFLVFWLAGLLCYFFLATQAAVQTSMTVDEGLHIASGYTIWRTGDYRLVEEHPPLVKLWLTLPLLPVGDLPNPRTLPAWAEAAIPTAESLPLLHMAEQLVYPYAPLDRLLVPARVMSALLGVLLLALVARWGGWPAVWLAACDPNLLAHGAVAGTDMGATTWMLLGLFAGHHFLRRPTVRRALATGALLGGALAAKLTALLLGPALGLAALWALWQFRGASHRKVQSDLLRYGALVLCVTALTFWGVYGFQVGRVAGFPFPLPAAAHAIPMMRLTGHVAGGHPAYLLGENNAEGWWAYFPIAFILKTPLPTLLLAFIAWGWLAQKVIRQRSFDCLGRHLPLWSFAAVYILATLFSTLNIGYRHLLPLLPVLYIGIGSMGVRKRWLFYGMALAQVSTAFYGAPDFLGYFNALAGGAENGWRYLADSNTDWGQGYKALARFQADHGIETVQLAAFIFNDPAEYGVRYTPLTPLGGDTPAVFPSRIAPPPGKYVIGATPLDGIPLADPEMYDWFRWRAPDAQIARALHYYHVTPEENAVAWVAQCLTPTVPLTAEALTFGFGRADLRRVEFDCTQSWVYPTGVGGLYVLHGALLGDTLRARLHYAAPPIREPFAARHLAEARITYRQRAYRDAPAFAVYTAPTPVMPTLSAWSAAAETPPLALTGQAPLAGPPTLDAAFAFLGAEVERTEAALDVETWWRVTAPPSARPFSLMAHLISPDGRALANADGLGAPAVQWQSGDILIQRHRFPLMAGELWLRTGVYWLDTGERWATATGDAIFIPLNWDN